MDRSFGRRSRKPSCPSCPTLAMRRTPRIPNQVQAFASRQPPAAAQSGAQRGGQRMLCWSVVGSSFSLHAVGDGVWVLEQRGRVAELLLAPVISSPRGPLYSLRGEGAGRRGATGRAVRGGLSRASGTQLSLRRDTRE